MMPHILVFYPYFPTYRRQILKELGALSDITTKFAAGMTGRADITPLSPDELPELHMFREIRIGPVSIHPEIVRHPFLKQFDVVVLAPATLSLSVWAVLLARRFTGRSTLLWGQCGRPGERGLKRSAQEAMNRLATGLLVYGKMGKQSACELGTNPDKVKIVRNAGDHEPRIATLSSGHFAELSHSRGIGKEPRSVPIHLLYVGRVTPGKKLERFLECVGLLRERGYDARATIVGSGTALIHLESLAQMKSLPIEFPGSLHTDDKLQPYFDKATIVVAPNSIGLLAIDALNNGIPVVYPSSAGQNGPEQEALTVGLNAVEFSELSGRGIANAVEKWLYLAPTVDIASFEAASRDSARDWSPKGVAQKIGAAVLASLNGIRRLRNEV